MSCRAAAVTGNWWLVLKEVNTSEPGGGEDIADLVRKRGEPVIAVADSFTSDGLGHRYRRYLACSRRMADKAR